MGKLIVEQIVSADGFAAPLDKKVDFMEAAGDISQLDDDQLEMLAHVDAILLGATTYRMFVDYWPTDKSKRERVAPRLNELPKHVFSSTLKSAPWGSFAPASLERGGVKETVAALKQRYEKDLVVWGSLTLTEALFRDGLVDELHMRSVPLLLGAGIPVAPREVAMTKLKLTSMRAFPAGNTVAVYSLR